MSELIVACKALPDFNTLQIVRFPTKPPSRCNCDGPCYFNPQHSAEEWEQELGDYMSYLEEWAIDCLKKPEMGRLEGEGRERTTLRTIEFSGRRPYQSSAKVKEYEV